MHLSHACNQSYRKYMFTEMQGHTLASCRSINTTYCLLTLRDSSYM